MTVTAVDRIWNENSNLYKTDAFRTGYDHTERWTAVVDNIAADSTPAIDSVLSIRADPMLAANGLEVGASHPSNDYLIIQNLPITRTSPLTFDIEANYKLPDFNFDPELDPALSTNITKIRYFTIKQSGEIDEDVNGEPIVTANAEPMRGVVRPFSDLGIQLSRSFPAFDSNAFYEFVDAVNTAPFMGFPTGTARVDAIEAEQEVIENAFAYFNITTTILIRRPVRTTADKAWYFRTAHKGFNVKEGADIVHARDKQGNLESQPVLLKADGTRETNAANTDWKEFELYDGADITTMGY